MSLEPLPLGARVRPAPGVHFRELDGEAVLLQTGTGLYFALNETGARAWSLFAAGVSLGEAAASLEREVDAPAERIFADLAELVAELERHGLVEVVRPG
jgi:hypothetical protein